MTAETNAAEAKPPSEMFLPDYRLARWQHLLSQHESLVSSARKAELKALLLKEIEGGNMSVYYSRLCTQYGWIPDDSLETRMKESNDEELKALEAAYVDAVENYGDVEVRDALHRKGHFYCRIGDKENALMAYSKTFEVTIGPGGRLDLIYGLIRMGLCDGDSNMVKTNVARAKSELTRGADWERLNKLKVYEGIYLMTVRKFKEAAELFLKTLASFTATEILDFETFVFYTIVLALLHLERPILKSKIASSPEVLQVIAGDHDLGAFMNAFVNCDYKTFMRKLIPISERIRCDQYLSRHYLYFIRVMRLRAYAQYLEPFKSVTMNSMASAFGVSQSFMEQEVVSFMASNRLNNKIDKVNGIIEAEARGDRDTLYKSILTDGDSLLNRLQKLSRVIDV